MKWRGRRRSDNVEDRRGGGPLSRQGLPRGARVRVPRGGRQGGPRRAGGASLVLFALVAVALWVFAGINPLQLVEVIARQDGAVATQPERRTPQEVAANDERAAFLSVVLAETEDTWRRIFRETGGVYDPPTLVLYSGFTQSACGLGSAATGPFYCPADRTVYVDLSFFDLLARRFDAPGDFAQAYVLAHEVGHHVQNEAGTLQQYQELRQRRGAQGRARLYSIAIELQADCYAGIWAHHADRVGLLEEGDIDEALNAAAAVGDDVMQRRRQGYVVPESFNHGTARQRSRWFATGYRSGDPADCDTLEAPSL
jgi:predicted metalloprotease